VVGDGVAEAKEDGPIHRLHLNSVQLRCHDRPPRLQKLCFLVCSFVLFLSFFRSAFRFTGIFIRDPSISLLQVWPSRRSYDHGAR
jgi:hypothetical protein